MRQSTKKKQSAGVLHGDSFAKSCIAVVCGQLLGGLLVDNANDSFAKNFIAVVYGKLFGGRLIGNVGDSFAKSFIAATRG